MFRVQGLGFRVQGLGLYGRGFIRSGGFRSIKASKLVPLSLSLRRPSWLYHARECELQTRVRENEAGFRMLGGWDAARIAAVGYVDINTMSPTSPTTLGNLALERLGPRRDWGLNAVNSRTLWLNAGL